MRNQPKEQRNHNQTIPMRNQPKEHIEKSLPITQTTIQNYRNSDTQTHGQTTINTQKDRKKEEQEEEEKEDEEKRQCRETYGEGRAKQREEMGGVVQRESRDEMRGVRELNN